MKVIVVLCNFFTLHFVERKSMLKKQLQQVVVSIQSTKAQNTVFPSRDVALGHGFAIEQTFTKQIF